MQDECFVVRLNALNDASQSELDIEVFDMDISGEGKSLFAN